MNREEKLKKIRKMKEENLTKNCIIPLFKEMGYENVRCTHKTGSEFGKDIICYKNNEFFRREYTAIQVKRTRIGTRDTDGILRQISEAFGKKFTDTGDNKEKSIDKFILLTSNDICEDAKQSLSASLRGISRARDVNYIDGEMLVSLLERYSPSFFCENKSEKDKAAKIEPLRPPIDIVAPVISESRSPVKVLLILKGASEDMDQSSQVFDIMLANKSNAQIILAKYEIRWRYRQGTAEALARAVPLKPMAKYIIRIPIDINDESWKQRSDVLDPVIYFSPKNRNNDSLAILRIQVHYCLTDRLNSHKGSDWDIIFDLHLFDNVGRKITILSNYHWNKG